MGIIEFKSKKQVWPMSFTDPIKLGVMICKKSASKLSTISRASSGQSVYYFTHRFELDWNKIAKFFFTI